MAGNSALSAAVKAKKDEFYTQLTDIEKEMRYYRKHFKDKTVLCNCDDPFESNFFKYFVLNFNRLGLKKLIATCYFSSPIIGQQLQYHFNQDGQMTFSFGDDTSDDYKAKRPYKAIVTSVYDTTGDGGVDMVDVAKLFMSGENELSELDGDGDFRSQECLELLDESDIVVTNPPFSLFREYIATLMQHEKKFIIIGNVNAITYKEVFGCLLIPTPQYIQIRCYLTKILRKKLMKSKKFPWKMIRNLLIFFGRFFQANELHVSLG